MDGKPNNTLNETIVLHLNKIGSLNIYILLPDELKSNPKEMKFLHKSDNNKLQVIIKNKNNKILSNFSYLFTNNNSFSIINLKNTLPKIISLNVQNNLVFKYLYINYSITKSTINDYYFADKIMNYDTLFDYITNIISESCLDDSKDYNKIFIDEIVCKSCNNILINSRKELMHDYDSSRIEQNLEEFFNFQNNYNSFMSNKDATSGISELNKKYFEIYNLNDQFLWVCDMNQIKDNKNNNFIRCSQCNQIIGKNNEQNNMFFKKLFLNQIKLKISLDNNKNSFINIKNILDIEFLNILLINCIKNGKKILKFINEEKDYYISFDTKINIVGLTKKYNNFNKDKNNSINVMVDDYVNFFEVAQIKDVKNQINMLDNDENCMEVVLNNEDFGFLENTITENIKIYSNDMFFYRLLTNDHKKYYCANISNTK